METLYLVKPESGMERGDSRLSASLHRRTLAWWQPSSANG